MSTRIGFSADWHFEDWPGPLDAGTGLSARLMDYVRTATAVATQARERGCAAFVVCGDFTEKGSPAPWLVDLVMEALEAGPKRVIAVRGNHDRGKRGRTIVDLIGRVEGWTGVRSPRIDMVGTVAVCSIPYMETHHLRALASNETADIADLFRLAADTYLGIARGLYARAMELGARRAILTGHQTLSGGWMSSTQQAFMGDQQVVVDAVALSSIGYSLVAFGHLHRAQTVIDDPACPVVYAGAIERVSFGEQDEEKSWLVVDVPDEGPVSIERVPTTARRYVTIAGDDLGDEPVDIEGAIVRVRDLPPEYDPALVRADLEQRGAFEVREPEVRRVDAQVAENAIAETLTVHEAYREFWAEHPERDALMAIVDRIANEIAA